MKAITKYVWGQLAEFRGYIIASFALLMASDILGLCSIYLYGSIINELPKLAQGGGWQNTITFTLISIAVMVISHVIMFLREHIDIKKYFFDVDEKIERHAMDKITMLSLGQHMKMNSSVVHETVSKGISAIGDFLRTVLFSLLPNVMYVIFSLVAISLMSWQMGFLVISLSASWMYASIRLNKSFEGKFLNLKEEDQKRSKFKSEMLRNVVSVKLGGIEQWFTGQYSRETTRVNQISKSVWVKYSMLASLIGLIRVILNASVLLFGVYLVYTGKENLGAFAMFVSWTSGVTGRLGSIRNDLRGLARSNPSIVKYLELIAQDPDLDETGTEENIPFGRIHFDNVSYRYPEDKNKGDRGISNVTFEIHAGETVGIVGQSGAGKSTMVKLLLRGWDPHSGGIYIDNIPLSKFSRKFRQNFAFVEQEGQLFDETIRFNLTFGMNKEVDDQTLWQILRDVKLEERVMSTEKGLGSMVGERGIRLSGGERQRLLMARAMARKAKILILDEATSNLDVETEDSIFQSAIQKASVGSTTIIIAHRFATLKSCNRVIVMDEGKLIAFDTHEELMRYCSVYRNLVEKQNLVTA
ncbi:MAG: ATP-binding cassette, subfamily bacterial [Patescibacteria group bacterium]|jgi:ABC-type multidrug transport system fused ATPase/permease subunit|nr:ATP-binding cassette, subfamily bacterial [Patescibacteria group bacterium]